MTSHPYKIGDQVRRTKTGIPHLQPAYPSFASGHVFEVVSVTDTFVVDDLGNRHVLEYVEHVDRKPSLRTAIHNALCECPRLESDLESDFQDAIDIIERHVRLAL